MSIATELTLLANSKQAIKNSINAKGGSITDSTPFADYSTAIDNLPSGGSGNPLLTSIDVSDFTGTTFSDAKSYITNVTIPSGVTTIGYNALQNCTNITSITIPTSVRTIGHSAFAGCTGLTSVNIASLSDWFAITFEYQQYGSTGPSNPLYSSNNSTLYAGGNPVTGTLSIPNTVTEIKQLAFIGYDRITGISFPSSVTRIGYHAFDGCTGLTSVDVPDTVTSISESAFKSCTSLTKVKLGNGVAGLNGYTFNGCTSLTTLELGSSITSLGYGETQSAQLSTLICHATTPPTIMSNSFSFGSNYSIYVPAESVETYKSASNWSSLASRIYPIQQVATVDGNPVYNYDLGNTDSTTIMSTEMDKLPTGTSIEFAEGITNMSGSISGYTTVTLPSTFTTFNDQDMIGSSVTTLTMKSTTPPTAERNKLGGSGLTAIYVPSESVDTYKADSGWSNFASIIQAIPVQAKMTITLQDDSTYVVPSDGSTTLNNDDLWNAITDSGEIDSSNVKKIEVGEMITELEDIYFDDDPNDPYYIGTFDLMSMSELVLPASLTAMGENTFANGGASSSITCYAVTPPTFTGVITGNPRRHPTIYVPAESVEAYQTAWSNNASWIQAIPTE